ncbi:membrane protein [Streptomyces hygroscopicus subsp. hygroscopicus]|nr:mannosyltransferase family protein [Streptomyces hygroscopicus]GLX53121.1 membrane protein [Streptomyces hygroscopicus subsp. hygroscopicus]
MSTFSPQRRDASARERPGPSPRGRERRAWPPGVQRALVLFGSVRVAGVILVVLVNLLTGRSILKGLAHSWDSVWYLHIATHGYGSRLHITDTGSVQTDWAFFPLYPGLIRALDWIPLVSPAVAALLIAWTATALAAVGVYAIGHRLHGRSVATAMVALWAVLPHSVVLTLAYTEPLFIALAVWCLYALLDERWPAAGALAALAGLTRPNGYAAAAAVLGVAAVEAVRRRGRVPLGLWAGALAAPLGWMAYLLLVGHRTGALLHGYFQVQSAWESRFDGGLGTLRFLATMPLTDGVIYPVALVVVAAGVFLFVRLCRERVPLALLLYTAALLLPVVLVSGPFESKPRFLLPAFPLLIPAARALVHKWRTDPDTARRVCAYLAGFSLLYGTYLATFANHSP